MAKVRFSETVTTREARPQTFVAGEVYDLPEASANRWVIRGKAERADDEPLAAAVVSLPVKPPAGNRNRLLPPGGPAGLVPPVPTEGV